MNLVGIWMHAERSAGRMLKTAIADLNRATGRRYTYKRVWEWRAEKRDVPTPARTYMLHAALPFILKCVAVKLGPKLIVELEEMLR